MNKSDLIEKLRSVDEVLLLELLEINSTEIVDAFLDKVNERLTYIYKQLEEIE